MIKAANEKKKKGKISKSIIVFDVKVYDEEEDFEQLWGEIILIKKDGLVWNQNFEIRPVAYTMNKLTMSMVCEDEKIGVDELYEEITELVNGAYEEERIQSIDTVTFNKLWSNENDLYII